MGRLGEVALLFALFVLLGTLHGTKAQYDEYDEYDYDESDYNYEDDYGEEADYQEEDEDASGEEVGDEVIGEPPQAVPRNREFTPECNNENCWIRVDWEPPPRDTWMSCLLGYRVGYRGDTGYRNTGIQGWIQEGGQDRTERMDLDQRRRHPP